MSTSPHVPDGGDLLAMEIREEAGRLIAHPIEEVKRLERVAAEGENATTPLLTTIGVGLALGSILAILTMILMVVYYRA